ncbi:MAG TPA: formylglycine-generating enzyme family protein [Lacunisphaera sp.]|jgi:formylglycine-generating enzyme required for sulfatase activity
MAAVSVSFADERPKTIPAPGGKWTVSLSHGVMLDLQWIPAGTFLRGSPETEPGRKADEGPQSRVTLTQGFWLGKTPITIAQWKQVMHLDLRGQLARRINDDTRYDLGGKSQPLRDFMRWSREADLATYLANEDDNLPMYFVSWNDVSEFCQRLTEIERVAGRLPAGYEYNLPTEAQWEYACRAGTTPAIDAARNKPESLNRIAWYDKNSADGYKGRRIGPTHSGPRTVGQKEPNSWELYDMYGNIWQWCRDWYGPYAGETTIDPTGPNAGTLRVNRGGSFGSGTNALRPAARAANPPAEASAYRGFRIALCPAPLR